MNARSAMFFSSSIQCGVVSPRTRESRALCRESPKWRMSAAASEFPRRMPLDGVRGQPVLTSRHRTPSVIMSREPCILPLPRENSKGSSRSTFIAGWRLAASKAASMNESSSQFAAVVRSRSLDALSCRYSTMSVRPETSACRMALLSSSCQLESSSFIMLSAAARRG